MNVFIKKFFQEVLGLLLGFFIGYNTADEGDKISGYTEKRFILKSDNNPQHPTIQKTTEDIK